MPATDQDILVLFIASILVPALLLLLVVLFVVYHRKQMMRHEVKEKEQENIYNVALLKATISAQERERQRIAKDLHDGVGSTLTALKMNVMHLRQQTNKVSAQREFLDDTLEMLTDGIENVRGVSHELLPPTLRQFGLIKGLEELVRRFNQSGQLTVRMSSEVHLDQIDDTIALGVFRMVQELVSNTIKHAEAQHIRLTVKEADGTLHLIYQDDGRGVRSSATQHQGLGIMNIESRVKMLGGCLHLESEPGSGYQANVQIPLKSTNT